MDKINGTKPQPFTETETLKLRVLQLEGQLLDRTVKDWHAKAAALKTELETTRPGWDFLPETGQWQPKGAPHASATNTPQ